MTVILEEEEDSNNVVETADLMKVDTDKTEEVVVMEETVEVTEETLEDMKEIPEDTVIFFFDTELDSGSAVYGLKNVIFSRQADSKWIK